MGGKTDGVGFGLLEDLVVMRHGLGGVDNDEAAVFVNFFDDVFEISKLTTVEIGSAVDYYNTVVEILL